MRASNQLCAHLFLIQPNNEDVPYPPWERSVDRHQRFRNSLYKLFERPRCIIHGLLWYPHSKSPVFLAHRESKYFWNVPLWPTTAPMEANICAKVKVTATKNGDSELITGYGESISQDKMYKYAPEAKRGHTRTIVIASRERIEPRKPRGLFSLFDFGQYFQIECKF